MRAKTFIQNLSQCIFEEYRNEIPKQELKSSFVQAIKKISAGKLKDELNSNFDKNFKILEKSLKDLCMTELPPISSPLNDSLEELTKSELDGRTDITEEDSTKQVHKMLYNLMDGEPKRPKVSVMKKLDDKQRKLVYRTFLRKVFNREVVSDTLIRTVIQDFDDLCDISQTEEEGKSKFDWLPMCNLLLEIVTGSKPVAFIRVLKVLFETIQNDVNKTIAKRKAVRSGKLANILKTFITSSHMNVDKNKLKEKERKIYCRYVSALLSLFVDLCCTHSSKVEQKKLFGREIAGYVCYILQPWPESLLEVALQLQGLEDENYNILLPLINKCLEVKPSGRDHVYYLKYVLLVRQIKDAYGEFEQIQEWNFTTKNIPAKAGFLDWLNEECPEAVEYIPVEDKKFKNTKVTRFLLEEAEDDLITVLLNSLSKEDEENTDDVEGTEKDKGETDVAMETENLFYLDTAGLSSLDEEKATEDQNSNKTIERKLRSKHKTILLKTVEEVEKLVDFEVLQDGTNSPQTYTLDPKFVMEKVRDPEDQKFLQSEIISITSVSSMSLGEEPPETEGSEATVKGNESQRSNDSEKSSLKLSKSNSSTPNKERKNKKGRKDIRLEANESDISAIEKSEDFCDSITSASEDDHKVKSVVRKVTPKKMKAKTMKSPNKDKVLDDSKSSLQDTKSVTTFSDQKLSSNKQKSNESKDDIKDTASVIMIDDSDANSDINGDTARFSIDSCDSEKLDQAIKNEEILSPVHESSAEIVDIVLEAIENSENFEEQSVEGGKETIEGSKEKRESLSKAGSPRKSMKKQSPRKELAKKCPVVMDTINTEENALTDSLSCMSGLSTATNYSESVVTSTSFISESDQNTITESDLDNTVKYVRGKRSGSSNKSASESETDACRDKPRKSSKKSLSGEEKEQSDLKRSDTEECARKSPVKSPNRKMVSEMHAAEENEGNVFELSPEKDIEKARGMRSIEEKFIGKAIKGKKTPKKSTKNVVQEVSGSVSLFNDDFESQEEIAENQGKRTKSTEEIFEIIEEIKEKIKTPKTRKMSIGKEKLNESMFTDDSIESLERDSEKESKELRSPEKKRIVGLKSSEKVSPRKKTTDITDGQKCRKSSNDEKFDVQTTELLKSPVKVSNEMEKQSNADISENSKSQPEMLVIDLSDDENTNEKEVKKDLLDADKLKNTEPCENMSPTKNEKEESKITEETNIIGKTPSPEKKSPMKINGKRTPSKRTPEGDSSKLKSPVKAVVKSPAKLSNSSGENVKPKISVSGTPDKKRVSPKKTTPGTSNKDGENGTVLRKTDETFEIVSDSDTDSEVSDATKRTPRKKIDEENTGEVKTKIKTPQSSKRNAANEKKENLKTPEVKSGKHVTPKSDSKKTPAKRERIPVTPKSASKKTPAEKEGIPVTPKSDSKKTQAEKEGIPVTQKSDSKKTPAERERIPVTPKSDSKKTPAERERIPVTPKSASKKTPVEKEGIPVTPKSDSKKIPAERERIPVTPKSDSKKIPAEKEGIPVTPKSAAKKSPEEKEGKPVILKSDSKKTPEENEGNHISPKSDSKKTQGTRDTTSLLKTPQSNEKKKLTPAKAESASKKSSPALRQLKENNSDSGNDFVPSSQKKSRTKPAAKSLNKEEETEFTLSLEDSEDDLASIPDIGAHLKPESAKTVDSKKSPHVPAALGTNSSQKGKNESTPVKGRRQSNRIKHLPEQTTEPEKDTETKKRVTRNRSVSETVVESEKDSDVDGPSRPKRIRSATKAVPETLKPTASRVKNVKSKTALNKIYDYHSETDASTDQSDFETRRTRKSLGGQRLTAIKDKIPESVEEEPVKELCTPPSKLARQRKGSASTTKKAVKKLDEIKGTRKRRLSAELMLESSPGKNSTDSEVSFPKSKSVAAASDKKSKRLSTPAVSANKEPASDAAGRRYSLRKK